MRLKIDNNRHFYFIKRYFSKLPSSCLLYPRVTFHRNNPNSSYTPSHSTSNPNHTETNDVTPDNHHVYLNSIRKTTNTYPNKHDIQINSATESRLNKWRPGTISKSGKSGVLSLEEQEKVYGSLNMDMIRNANNMSQINYRNNNEPHSHALTVDDHCSESKGKGRLKNRRIPMGKANTENGVTSKEQDQHQHKPILYFDPLNPKVFQTHYVSQTPEERKRTWKYNMKNLTGFEKMEFLKLLLQMGYVQESLDIFDFLNQHQMLVRLSYVGFHRMIFLLLPKHAQYKEQVMKIFKWMKEFGHVPTNSLLCSLIRFAKNTKNLSFALHLESKIRYHCFELYDDTLNHLLSLCAQDGTIISLKEAIRLWEDHAPKGSVNALTVYHMISIYGRLKDGDGVKRMEEYVQQHAHFLVEKLSKTHHKKAYSVFQLQVNNNLLKAWIQCDRGKEALHVFDTLVQENNFNYNTISTMLMLAEKRKDVGMAKDVIELYLGKGLEMDEQLYGKMIVILGRAGQVEDADRLFHKATIALSLDPIDEPYHKLQVCLMRAFLDSQRYEKTAELYESMQNSSSLPKDKMMRSAFQYGIEAYVHLKDLDAALNVLKVYNVHKKPTLNLDPFAKNVFDEEFIVNWFEEIHNPKISSKTLE